MATVGVDVQSSSRGRGGLFAQDTPAFQGNDNLINLRWNNVGVTIKGKEILKGITGKADSKTMTALMGPSGAGKTTLLNVLAGRFLSSKKKNVSGDIYANEKRINPRSFRRYIAFVLQEDALVATATVRESLEFSAKLRLPKSTPLKERSELVQQLISALGLSHVQNSFIGSELVRGVSGGEKKRCAIGVELVTRPSILFLDEPTSGLDSFAAFKVVQVLKSLSRSGTSVLCTIHQPSSEIFVLFDKAIVLRTGEVMYSGEIPHMVSFLGSQGYDLPENTNPADYVILLAQTISDGDIEYYNEDAKVLTSGDVESNPDSVEKGGEIQELNRIGLWEQLVLLARREVLDTLRNKAALVAQVVITTLMGLLFAAIFYQVGDFESDKYSLQSHFGALTNLLISAMFGSSQQPLLTFPLERVTFIREYSNGSYGGIAYLFSKLLVEIPKVFIMSILQVVVAYWMMGLQGNVILLILIIFLVQVVSSSYAYLVGALVANPKQAQEFAPLLFVPQLLFLGFFISIEQIPVALQWVQYLCSLKYGLNLAMILEFGDCPDLSQNGTFPFKNYAEQCQEILSRNDIEEDLTGTYIGILLGIFVLFRGLSIIGLIWRARNYSV